MRKLRMPGHTVPGGRKKKRGNGGKGSNTAQIGTSLTRQQQVATSQQYKDTKYACVLTNKLNLNDDAWIYTMHHNAANKYIMTDCMRNSSQ